MSEPAQANASRFPSMDHVWMGAVVTAVALRGLAWPISPADFWWQTAMGRWIVDHGALPVEDTFSWTRHGEAFFDQPWLSQVALYGLWRTGGATASLLAIAALLLLTQGQLLQRAVRRTSHVQAASVMVLLSLPVQMTNWELRSQLLALPLFAFTLVQLDRWRAREHSTARTVAFVVPCTALWVNLHGSFPLALVLAALFGVGRVWEAPTARRTATAESAVLGTAMAAATCAHPYGPGVWSYVLRMLEDSDIQHEVSEWAAPTLTEPVGQLFFAYAAAMGLLAGVAAYRTRRVSLFEGALLAAFGLLALTSMRHILWFGMVATPFAAGWLAALWDIPEGDDRTGSPALNSAVLLAFALMVAGMLPPVKAALPLPPALRSPLDEATPVAAVSAIRAMPETPARLFHSQESGSYLMYAAPEIPVFIDARVELYPAEQVADYRALSQAEGVEERIVKYGFDGMLLDRERFEPLVAWMDSSSEWTLRYSDPRFSYWTPTHPKTAP